VGTESKVTAQLFSLRQKEDRNVSLDRTGNQGIKSEAQSQMEDHPATNGLTGVNRRDWVKTAVGVSVGLALDGLLDLPTVRAATQKLKLANVSEFTTSCNFCSCGCGMIAAVREGKLISMEGDYDHIVNRGSLCVKGISMFATHASPNRLTTPRYRAPGSDHWEDISWDDAITRVAQKIRMTRDATWIATEKVDGKEVPVNRTDAIGFLGGAQNTNEECYLFQKAARLLGLAYVEHQARL
jgi:formate dehydrogenase major subunit